MNWNDPIARLHLAERVGVDEYNRRISEWIESQVKETVNGYKLRFMDWLGMWQVMDTTRGFKKVEEARDYANSLEPGPHV